MVLETLSIISQARIAQAKSARTEKWGGKKRSWIEF